jgi:hypothetical protein
VPGVLLANRPVGIADPSLLDLPVTILALYGIEEAFANAGADTHHPPLVTRDPMFGGKNIRVEQELFERLKKAAEVAGYASVDEFVTHLIERELGKPREQASDEEVKKRLEGLGYIS